MSIEIHKVLDQDLEKTISFDRESPANIYNLHIHQWYNSFQSWDISILS